MATHAAIPTATTLSSAITKIQNEFLVASASNWAAGNLLIVGDEAMRLLEVNTTTGKVKVMRGELGTLAQAHPASAIVYYGTPATFLFQDGKIGLAGYDGTLGTPTLPLGTEWVDPRTGYLYTLVDAGATHVVGEPVVFDANFRTAAMAATAKGRVGIVVDAGGASDKATWLLTRGSYASTMTTSDVTTTLLLSAGTNCFDVYDSDNAIRVYGATATTAPSTATSPTYGGGLATVYLDNAWCNGVAEFVS